MTPNDSLIVLVAALRSGEVSAVDYCERLLARARAWEPRIRAFAALDEARAIGLAQMSDGWAAPGNEPAALRGVPVGVKDIIDTADLPTEIGSPIFAGRIPPRDAKVVQRLIAAGAYVFGKTVTTEFAYMQASKTRNPWNLEYTPGGSSSGSAAAVAAGLLPAALGTQTNGSVIRPAAYCGVVGFKPTYDLLSTAGVFPFSTTLDTVGVFTRSVADAALLASVLAEGESIAAGVASLSRPPRIGVIEHYPWNRAEPAAAASFRASLHGLAGAGAELHPVTLGPEYAEARDAHRVIMLYEAVQGHGALQSSEGAKMSAELRAGLDEGRGISVSAYRAAMAMRAALAERAADLFEDLDAIASPPAPGAAPRDLGVTGDPSFCTLWSLTGFPAITLPSALDAAGMPLGVQLAAPAAADNRLLDVAAWCEVVLGFTHRPPAS